MKFKVLKVVLVGMMFTISGMVSPGLISNVDVFNDGSNLGFSQKNSSLVWLDLSVNKNFSISSVNQRLTTDLQGYRWANETEVLSLWYDIFFSKMGQDALPILTGLWFGANTLSAGVYTHLFFEALSILGATPIEKTTNGSGYTYSRQPILGYFESQYNNYGYAFADVFDKSFYRSCDPSPCFEEPVYDRVQIWYFDDAMPLYKGNPDDSFSNASSFLVKVKDVPEPSTLLLVLFIFIGSIRALAKYSFMKIYLISHLTTLMRRLVMRNLVKALVTVCAIGMANAASAGVITVHMEGQITNVSNYGASGLLGSAVSMTATLDLDGNGLSYCHDSGYSCDGNGDDFLEVVVGFEVYIDENIYINNGYHLSILHPSIDPNFPVYQYAIGGYTTGPDLFGFEMEGFTFYILSTQLPGYTYLTTPPPAPVDSYSQFYYGANFCGYLLNGPSLCGDISTVTVGAQGANVSEPTTITLLALSLFGVGAAARRRRL
jgi:hypothetical protein